MWDGFCGNLIRTLNRNLLIATLVVFAGLIGFFGYNARYFLNFFQGTHAINGAQLAAINPASAADRFVTIRTEKVARTGITHVTTNKEHPQGYVDSRYLLAKIDDHFLIVRTAGDFAPLSDSAGNPISFQGRLRPVPHDLGSLLDRQSAALGNVSIPPFYLDTEDYREFGYMSLVFGVPVLLLGCWMLWVYQRSSSEYANHRFARRLARYGQLEALVQQLDSEIAGAHKTVRGGAGNVELTTHWIIAKTTFAATPMRLDSVVWIHRLVVKQKAYFVTINKMYSVVAYDKLGQKLVVQLTEAQTTELLKDIAAAAPQAVTGYDKKLAKLWRSSKDKAVFRQAAGSQFAGATLGDRGSPQWL